METNKMKFILMTIMSFFLVGAISAQHHEESRPQHSAQSRSAPRFEQRPSPSHVVQHLNPSKEQAHRISVVKHGGVQGRSRDWLHHNRWHPAPRWIRPVFGCSIGFVWSVQPTNFVTVWVLDSDGNYYPAYYYPQYGYYAWQSSPLIAVGVYNPNISVVINLI